MTVTVLQLDHFAADPLVDPMLEVLMAPGDPPAALGLLELLAQARPAWHAQAACADVVGVDFFPPAGAAWEPAARLCSACDVQPACLAWAAGQGTALAGVWGGSSARERRRAGGDPVALAAMVEPRLDQLRRSRAITSARVVCVDCGDGDHGVDDRGRCLRCAARVARIAAEEG